MYHEYDKYQTFFDACLRWPTYFHFLVIFEPFSICRGAMARPCFVNVFIHATFPQCPYWTYFQPPYKDNYLKFSVQKTTAFTDFPANSSVVWKHFKKNTLRYWKKITLEQRYYFCTKIAIPPTEIVPSGIFSTDLIEKNIFQPKTHRHTFRQQDKYSTGCSCLIFKI